MKIKLSPARMDEHMLASVSNDTIIINDISFDFSQLDEGESLPADAISSKWICSDVHRIDGEIYLTLLLSHGINAPHETRFPAAFTSPMTVTSGPVPLPPYDADADADDEEAA